MLLDAECEYKQRIKDTVSLLALCVYYKMLNRRLEAFNNIVHSDSSFSYVMTSIFYPAYA